jgi:hypothetical protein
MAMFGSPETMLASGDEPGGVTHRRKRPIDPGGIG